MSAQAVGRGAAEEIEAFERDLRRHIYRADAPAGTGTLRERAAETRDRLLALGRDQIRLELNPQLLSEIRGYLLAATANLNDATGEAASADWQRQRIADALVDLEALRHILRDGIDHEPLRSTQTDGSSFLTRSGAVDQIGKWLPRLNGEQQAALLGIDARQARRWRDDVGKPASRRVELVVELVGVLRHSWTDEGVVRWFERPHPMLDGRAPMDLIDDLDWESRVRDAANATRAQTAT